MGYRRVVKFVLALLQIAGGNFAHGGNSVQVLEADGDVQTLARAVIASRAAAPGFARKIILRWGVYPVDPPVVLTSLDSGLTIQSAH